MSITDDDKAFLYREVVKDVSRMAGEAKLNIFSHVICLNQALRRLTKSIDKNSKQ